MWRWFLGIAAVPSAMVAIAYRLLPESPRFLQVMGRHDEAMQVSERASVVGVPGIYVCRLYARDEFDWCASSSQRPVVV